MEHEDQEEKDIAALLKRWGERQHAPCPQRLRARILNTLSELCPKDDTPDSPTGEQ